MNYTNLSRRDHRRLLVAGVTELRDGLAIIGTMKTLIKKHCSFMLSIALLLMLPACSCVKVLTVQDDGVQREHVMDDKPAQGDVDAGKAAFFAKLKPAIVQENRRISALRQELFGLRQVRQLDISQQQRVRQIAVLYRAQVMAKPDALFWQRLLNRVDEVPLEMALVQAASESEWGRSCFAGAGHNHAGQSCMRAFAAGDCPQGEAMHHVDSMQACVRAYMLNINRSPAYAEFRNIRHSLRVQSRALDAESLVYGLSSYSERGMAYVKEIRSMIRSNRVLISNS
ncbi:MAG: glucosaminidase domain-containing protein [Mariprofundus sp.]